MVFELIGEFFTKIFNKIPEIYFKPHGKFTAECQFLTNILQRILFPYQ